MYIYQLALHLIFKRSLPLSTVEGIDQISNISIENNFHETVDLLR